MNDTEKKERHRHGGGRVLTGVYMSEQETLEYEEACKSEGVTKSAQGVKLLTGWTQKIKKKASE